MSDRSTLAELFAPGKTIPELDDDDFRELVELIDEECIRRGWPCAPFEEPKLNA